MSRELQLYSTNEDYVAGTNVLETNTRVGTTLYYSTGTSDVNFGSRMPNSSIRTHVKFVYFDDR